MCGGAATLGPIQGEHHVEILSGAVASAAARQQDVQQQEQDQQDQTSTQQDQDQRQDQHRKAAREEDEHLGRTTGPTGPVPLPPPGPDRTGPGRPRGGRHCHHGRDQGGRELQRTGGGVLAPHDGRRVVGVGRHRDHGAVATGRGRALRPDRHTECGGEPVVGRPPQQGRERHRRAGRRRQAPDHLRGGRVLPLLRRRALGAGRGAVALRDVREPVGHPLVDFGRLPGHADTLVLRIDLLQPLCRLPGRRGSHESAGRRQLPDPADADGGAERPRGQVRHPGEHPVPRYRQPLRGQRLELLATGAAGALPEPDRG